MFKRTKVHAGVLAALGTALFFSGAAALAQEPQRIEITGSAIKRVDAEGALPVQTISRDAIEKSGATSIADLIQALPSMQGFTSEGSSVGGGGNGFSGASVHNLGETRTLVLLNGRRLALFAGQSLTGSLAGIDLNTIPIAAIDRIEVLTDGASALYGADAIGGVVNFITRKNFTDGSINVGLSNPSDGGKEKRLSASKGFGDLDRDGFNVMFGLNHETRTALKSVDREFAKTGVINLELEGRQVSFFNGSPRGIPANVTHTDGYLTSPYYAANGSCAPQHVALQEGPPGAAPACYYDYVTQLEILPERKRTAALVQGQVKLGRDHTLFAELMSSKTSNINRIAPPPGELLIGPGSPFYSFVLAVDPGATGDVVVPYRVADVGRRTQEDITKATHIVVGSEGILAGWDYNAAITVSKNKQTSNLLGGYVALTPFFAALDSGLVNPFVLPGNQSGAATTALLDSRILGFWEGGESSLNMVSLRASRELAQLAGGGLALAAGVSFANEKFQKLSSTLAQGIGDTRFGDSSAIVPYSADRDLRGVFAEISAPFVKGFELTGSLRHDSYSDFGGATTAKVSAKFQPVKSFAMRGSLGTGFKAPTVPQVNATRQEFGVTSGNYTCNNNDVADPLKQIANGLGAVCPTGNVQYNVFASGNKALDPERSTQWTVGVVFEPVSNVSITADLWQVKLKDSIGQVDEATIFGDPNRWRSLFTTYTDPGTGQVLLAILASNSNLGNQVERGIDLEVKSRAALGFGRLSTVLGVSYWLKNDYQLEKGGEFFSSLGKFGPDGNVVFKWQGKLFNTLDYGNWAHTLGLTFKAGYKDQAYTEADFAIFDPTDFTPYAYNGTVKRYTTIDWQTQWKASKMLTLTAGILNLTDQDPPRSLKSAGGGQQIGYDDRYYDPRGRTIYGNLEFKF